MLNADIIFSIVSLCIGVFYYVQSLKFPPGVGNVPGPAFYPQLVFYVCLMLTIILFLSGIKNKKVYFPYKFSDSRVQRGIFVIIITFLYLFFWGKGKFVINTPVYLTIIMIFLGEKWHKAIFASIVISLFVYYVFNNFFSVQLF